ncbi:MAG: ABC transporter substrate-binding protein [Candidatus Manganitrophaceae bacterium]
MPFLQFPRRIAVFLCLFSLILLRVRPILGQTRDPPEEKKPQRIVSLTLGSDEILLSLVDPKRIVAVTHLAVDPKVSHVAEASKAIPNRIQAGLEQVVALRPDRVITASYTPADVVNQLKEAGLPVERLEFFPSVDGIKQNIRAVGKAVGEEKRAEALVAEMERRLRQIAERVAGSRRRTVLFYSPTGVVAGKGTTFDEIATLAGARNLAAVAGIVGHQKISAERLIELDPEIILVSDWNPEEPDFDRKVISDPALQSLSAVRNRRVVIVPEKNLSTVSQYIVNGVEEIARVIHPERFAPPVQGDIKRTTP